MDEDYVDEVDPGELIPVVTADTLCAWVEELLPLIESQSERENARWCPAWWDHPEAVMRFTSLYVAHMHAIENGEESSWWVNHWDRQAPYLFGQTGIFERCQNGHDPERRFMFAKLTTPPTDWAL